MNAQSTDNSTNIELAFRREVKKYRALLRWGVDKVFQNSNIDTLFNEVRGLIDEHDSEKATQLLAELRKKINTLEDQYPKQKIIIEKSLFDKIAQLENKIDASSGVKLDQTHEYLQTLEIARVAIQNDDWIEAKNKISLVESDLSTIENKAKVAANTTTNDATNATTKKKTDPTTQTNIKTQAPKDKPTQKAAPKKLDLQKNKVRMAKKPTPAAQPPIKISDLLFATKEKSCTGKIISYNDLQKTFSTIDKSFSKNIRISFLATADVINRELSPLSKKTITLKDTSAQMVLLRLPISRELTIYIIGIPLNEIVNTEQIVNISSQTSSLFVDALTIDDKKDKKNKSKHKIASLIKTLSNTHEKQKNIYIKSEKDSLFTQQLLKDKNFLDYSDSLFIHNSQNRLIEDAALRLDQFSNITH